MGDQISVSWSLGREGSQKKGRRGGTTVELLLSISGSSHGKDKQARQGTLQALSGPHMCRMED